jgi:hypothetical protein
MAGWAMSMEQLQMLIDAASAAGEGAFWIVIAWLGIDVLKAALLAGVVCFVALKAGALILACTSADQLCREIAAKVGARNFDTWCSGDRRGLMRRIDALLDKEQP